MIASLRTGSNAIGAVDIGGTKIGVAAVSSDGRVLTNAECPTRGDGHPAETLDRAVRLLRQCAGETASSLAGIGIGCTGPVDPITGIVGNVDLLPGWEGINLAELFASEFGVSVAVENDADAAALAESQWGAGRFASRFIYVTVSTGIGAGVVLDRLLYRGVDGVHPEFGHQTIDDSGPSCYCGANGCWESLASGPALVSWLTRYQDIPEADQSQLTARDICDRARLGDPSAIEAVKRLGHYLGVGLGNLITLFCPDTIALGGGVMRSASLFFDHACFVARSRCGLVPASRTSIALTSLGDHAPLLGAAMAWQHRFRK